MNCAWDQPFAGNRNCPVCGDVRREPIYLTPTKQAIKCCSACGMVYAVNSPAVDYATSSIYTCATTYDGQPEHYRRIVRNVLGYGAISTRFSVLDVGCATGGLIQAFLDCGFPIVRGISLSRGEVDACRGKGLEAEVCDLADALNADLVTVSHVLEHVPDVHQFLTDLRRAACQFVYIEVPNALRYASCFTSVCAGFNAEHINHFDMLHLTQACTRAGIEVVAQGGYDIPIGGGRVYPAIWVIGRPGHATLSEAVEEYVHVLNGQIQKVLGSLARDMENVSEFALWGMGQTTDLLLEAGALDADGIAYATDTNPVFHGKRIGDCEVVAPESFRPPAEVPILVCSQMSQEVIVKRIRDLGLTNKVIVLEGK